MVQRAGSLAICIQGEVVEEFEVGVQPKTSSGLAHCAATVELPFCRWAWRSNILNKNNSSGWGCVQFDVPALVTNQKEFLQYGNGYLAKKGEGYVLLFIPG